MLEWTDREVEEFFRLVYAGSVTPERPSSRLYNAVLAVVMEALTFGFSGDETNLEGADLVSFQKFKRNSQLFVGHKVHQQAIDMVNAMFLEDGRQVPFEVFQVDAKSIHEIYNSTWLEVEKSFAERVATNASRWNELVAEKDALPYLEYVTVGDARVRPEHAELDGVTKKVTDPFWNVHYPPNGWNCRCIVNQVEDNEGKRSTFDGDNVEIDPMFRKNWGKSNEIFDKKHPYFKVGEEFKEFSKRNFGLPLDREQ